MVRFEREGRIGEDPKQVRLKAILADDEFEVRLSGPWRTLDGVKRHSGHRNLLLAYGHAKRSGGLLRSRLPMM